MVLLALCCLLRAEEPQQTQLARTQNGDLTLILTFLVSEFRGQSDLGCPKTARSSSSRSDLLLNIFFSLQPMLLTRGAEAPNGYPSGCFGRGASVVSHRVQRGPRSGSICRREEYADESYVADDSDCGSLATGSR